MQNYKTTKIKANGVNFKCIEKGSGPLLLCLHGFPDHALSFHKQLDFFAKKGYRVVAPFMRGYYPSDVNCKTFQTAALGNDVIEIIASLDYESAIIIGHDWGAAAANSAAIINSKVIKKLITASVTYGTFSQSLVTNYAQQKRSWYMYYFQLAFAEHAVPLNDFAFIKNIWKDWSFEVPQAELTSVIETFKQPGVLTAALTHYRHAFDTSQHDPQLIKEQARIGNDKITIPTLHIHGKEDNCIGVELCNGMEEFYANQFHKVIVEQAGHFVHLEQPDCFNQAVWDFIK
jgi:pimeloyl-ACP methyl ester carboxylesterase